MNSLIQLKTLGSRGRNPARSLPLRRGFLLIHLVLVCFAFAPQMRAASCHQVIHGGGNLAPPPHGGYCNFTTAEGTSALFNLNDGLGNTALGSYSLFNNTTASFNTGVGAATLSLNTTGTSNTAVGMFALFSNTTGGTNTGIGDDALFSVTTGNSNTALGDEAGSNLVDGEGNIYIGAQVQAGATDELQFIRIGDDTAFAFPYDTFIAGIFDRVVDLGTAVPVFVDDTGKLGTIPVDAVGNKVATPQAMLNESRNQQKRIAELEGTVARLAGMVKEQAAQIQKVSAQLEATKPAPQVVNNP